MEAEELAEMMDVGGDSEFERGGFTMWQLVWVLMGFVWMPVETVGVASWSVSVDFCWNTLARTARLAL